MIKLTCFISFALILLNTFFSLKKLTPLLTLIFLWLVIEFSFTSFISVIVDNAKLWEVGKNPKDFVIFRVVEVVVIPLLMLFYLEILNYIKVLKVRIIFTLTWILLLFGMEYSLVKFKVMKYVNWQIGWSFVTWFLFLMFIFMIQLLFNKILKKEGVIK
jgi:hypothetical protein